MKYIIVIATIFRFLSASSQFAIISDDDGYVNVRSTPNKGDNIIDKLNSGDMVYVFDTIGNWSNIDYGTESIKHGCVYSDRLKFISDYEEILMKCVKANTAELTKGAISMTVKQKAFAPSKHHYTYDREYNKYIELIDGNVYYGTDGRIPQKEYQSIDIAIGQKILINLPQQALKNLFEPSIDGTQAYYNQSENTIFITSWNSDGAGGYTVVWKIVNDQYHSRCVVHGF